MKTHLIGDIALILDTILLKKVIGYAVALLVDRAVLRNRFRGYGGHVKHIGMGAVFRMVLIVPKLIFGLFAT